jgi:hypothetical protein
MDKVERYETNSDFLEFLNKKFNETAVNATVEELAEFAFGSLQDAIKAFEKRRSL